MIEQHFEIAWKKLNDELGEPFVKYNKDYEPKPLTWDELAMVLNEDAIEKGFDKQYSSGESLRCMAKEIRRERGLLPTREDKFSKDKQDLFKERAKFHSELQNFRTTMKKEAGRDLFKEMIGEVADKYAGRIILTTPKGVLPHGKRSGILLLSDWHYGLVVDNYLNTFNPKIFLERIERLTTAVVTEIKKHQLETLYVLNLNDLISGIIHQGLRLQNSEDVIEQIIVTNDVLINMLQIFSEYTLVEYRDCIDNHSRIIPDKKLALSRENFSLLTPWMLRKAFAKNNRVTIVAGEFDEEIITLSVYDWNYLGVHGHLDNMNSVVSDMSLMTRRFYNVMFMGHNHHVAADEIHKTYVHMNGSLSGVDQFAKDIRSTSNPSQTLVIVSPDDCAEYIRTIKF
jgi:hypothetical protein